MTRRIPTKMGRCPGCIGRNCLLLFLLSICIAGLAGCGRTLAQGATEQLLASDAVDRTISQIDFRVLAGEKVYLDTQYINNVKGVGFVNADYIISSIRQQLVGSRCLLQESPERADYIVEARIGTLGTDGHEVTYGVPANNLLSAAASLVPTAPPLPTIPEISFAKRNEQLGAAKIGVFAYHRGSREPVWQSGITQARSTAKDTWLLGAGPFQRGTIHRGTKFAGAKLAIPETSDDGRGNQVFPVSYSEEVYFKRRSIGKAKVKDPAVESASMPADRGSGDDPGHEQAQDPRETVNRPTDPKPSSGDSPPGKISQTSLSGADGSSS